jgi:rubrerythrin
MASTATVSATTLANLQTAYEGESNARAKYTAFAVKAVEEGFMDVASLFRAATRAEQIHAENHARVIRKFGADPKCTIQKARLDRPQKTLLQRLPARSMNETSCTRSFSQKQNRPSSRRRKELFTGRWKPRGSMHDFTVQHWISYGRANHK